MSTAQIVLIPFKQRVILGFLMLFPLFGFCQGVGSKQSCITQMQEEDIELLHIVDYIGNSLGKPIVADKGILSALKHSKSTVLLLTTIDEFEKDQKAAVKLYGDILKIYGYTLIERNSTLLLCQIKSAAKVPNLPQFLTAKTDFDRVVQHRLVLKHVTTNFIGSYYRHIQSICPPIPHNNTRSLYIISHYSNVKNYIDLIEKLDVAPPELLKRKYHLKHMESNQALIHINLALTIYTNRNREKLSVSTTPILFTTDNTTLVVEATKDTHEFIHEWIAILDVEDYKTEAK